MNKSLESAAGLRHQILFLIKQEEQATIAKIASQIGVTYEAVRQQLRQLEAENLVARYQQRLLGKSRAGRRTSFYRLTPAGEHLFPKNYGELAVALIDALAGQLGPEALEQLLASLADAQVARWEPALRSLSLAERVEALREIYLEDDPFTSVDATGGELRLVERNCPFLHVASRRPALCSVTVSTLARLLGYRVRREKRFQDGDGRCVFHVLLDQPIDREHFRFELEPPALPA
jgi:predicted ArsR family transcriptional regulator